MDIDFPISTYCEWNAAKEHAAETGIRFHPEWQDFSVFFGQMGTCPDGAELELISDNLGYVPGNCNWSGCEDFPPSYAECPVATGLLKAGLIAEPVAYDVARIDGDPDSIRSAVAKLDKKTAGQTVEARSAAIADLLRKLIATHGLVPKGLPNRWQIRQVTRQIRFDAGELPL